MGGGGGRERVQIGKNGRNTGDMGLHLGLGEGRVGARQGHAAPPQSVREAGPCYIMSADTSPKAHDLLTTCSPVSPSCSHLPIHPADCLVLTHFFYLFHLLLLHQNLTPCLPSPFHTGPVVSKFTSKFTCHQTR